MVESILGRWQEAVEPITTSAYGEAIMAYCKDRGYPRDTARAVREMHRLHLQYEAAPSATPEATLDMVADAPKPIKWALRALGKTISPDVSEPFFRLAEDPAYARRVTQIYKRDVKPALGL